MPTSVDFVFIKNSGTANISSSLGEAHAGILSIGSGALNIQSGGLLSTQYSASIGDGTGSNGTATVNGGTWIADSQLQVGVRGTGTLSILNGGLVSSTLGGSIGGFLGSHGTVTVAGGTWTNNSFLHVGEGGSGSLNIQDGGLVSVGTFGAEVAINSGAIGMITLLGSPGSRGVLATRVIREYAGSGTLAFDGGILRATADAANFIADFEAGDVTINSGGAFIDSNGFNLGVATTLGGSGGLTKQGAGILALTGANTYAGGTTIVGGTLQVGNGGTTGSIAGGISNSGTLIFNRSDDLAHGSMMSGSGSLIKQGAGRLLLSGPGVAYTGSTSVLSGTLEILNNTSFNSPIALGSSATLTLDIASDVKLLQGVSGSGAIQVTGTATTARLAGDNSGFTGSFSLPTGARGMMWSNVNAGSAAASWDISGGFAAVETGPGASTVKLGALSGSNSATVIVTFGGSGKKTLEIGALNTNNTFAGTILDGGLGGGGTGTVALEKVGTGTLTLTGVNTYTGGTTVNGGTLRVAGSISGTLTVNAGGTVEGGGTIGGALNVPGGVVSPGNSGVGTLHVTGHVTLVDTSTTLMELAGGDSFDHVTDGGGLNFDGTLQLSLLGGFQPFLGQTFELFPDATETDLGAFDSILFSEPGYAGSFNSATGTLTIVAVPEPSTCALLGIALAGLALRRRKATA